MHRCKGVGGRHAEIRIAAAACTVLPFHPPGSNSDLHPPLDRLLGPQGIGQAGSDKVDTGEAEEVIDAVAKTVAELTSQQGGVIRPLLIEQLMRQTRRISP